MLKCDCCISFIAYYTYCSNFKANFYDYCLHKRLNIRLKLISPRNLNLNSYVTAFVLHIISLIIEKSLNQIILHYFNVYLLPDSDQFISYSPFYQTTSLIYQEHIFLGIFAS